MNKFLLYLIILVVFASMIQYLLEGDLPGAAGIGLSAYLLLDELRKLEEKGA